MELIEHLIFNIVFMPLLGAFASYFGGKHLGDRFAQIISSSLMVSAAIFSLFVFKNVVFDKIIYQVHLLEWIKIDNFQANWCLYVDSLTAVMLLVVTSVSAVVQRSPDFVARTPSEERQAVEVLLQTTMFVSSGQILWPRQPDDCSHDASLHLRPKTVSMHACRAQQTSKLVFSATGAEV